MAGVVVASPTTMVMAHDQVIDPLGVPDMARRVVCTVLGSGDTRRAQRARHGHPRQQYSRSNSRSHDRPFRRLCTHSGKAAGAPPLDFGRGRRTPTTKVVLAERRNTPLPT
jgi:hypothetical protein